VATAPADAISAMLAGATEVAPRCPTTRGVVFVFLTFARPPITGNLWTWFPEARYPFYRLSELPYLVPARAAPAAAWQALARSFAPSGQTAIAAELCDDPHGAWFTAADDSVIAATLEGLRAAYGLTEGPRAIRVVRAVGAYPTFRLAEEDSWRHPPRLLLPNLAVAGRAAEHRYLMVEHALDAGERAAADLLGALGG